MSTKLIHGDCRTSLFFLPENSVDAIVCDPPYEISFMGREWDGSGIAYDVEMWRAALGVLKPGGHLLAFSHSRTYHRLACAIEDAGFELRDQIMWVYGSGMPKSHNLKGEWEGWGTGLKPSHEPICVARKPLVGTVAANVMKFGTGALNIAACRVEPTGESRQRTGEASQERRYTDKGGTNFAAMPGVRGGDAAGRWPANLIHDGSDEVVALFPQAPGQIAKASTSGTQRAGQNVYGTMARGSNGADPRGDTGSAARFFYCAKASAKERGAGNDHPTVKPLALMRYLVKLVTPAGGVVLDHFMGSGSTALACRAEGFQFIGIDDKLAHIEIARSRLGL